jgi:hypothetical protein
MTESERYLAKLADRTFLRLWSYPNVFTDNRPNATGDGKELCDLFAICGDDAFLFSDKHIAWNNGTSTEVAWGRWYRRAIAKSVSQLAGAERWIADHPERLFLDPACTKAFPVELPKKSNLRVHKIAIAVGIGNVARSLVGGRGTLAISPALKGEDALRQPFAIGDVNPEGSFVHVFDETGFDLVVRELDTVTDFRDYLVRRAEFIRSGKLLGAPGEEELLGYYLQAENKDGEHGFLDVSGSEFSAMQSVIISEGHFDRLRARPEYRRKGEANEISYVWDRLVERFAGSMLDGTLTTPFGGDVAVSDAERGLRRMAQERRVTRRLLSESFVGALRIAEDRKLGRLARLSLPGPTATVRDLAYVFLVSATEPNGETYEEYRKRRGLMLLGYCLNTLKNYPEISKIVGIAVDASPKVTGRRGGSEDLVAIENLSPTDPLMTREQELTELFGIRDIKSRETSRIQVQEYPADPEENSSGILSRQQRRAMQRRARKEAR